MPDIPDGDRPLYNGSTVTRSHALALFIPFSIRHQLTNSARQDLLKFLNILLPECVPRTNCFVDKLFFQILLMTAKSMCTAYNVSHIWGLL